MYNNPPGDPRDPRFQGQQPPQPQYGQQPASQPPYGHAPPQPQQPYGQPPQAYGQQAPYGQQPHHGQPPPSMPPYGQPQYGAPSPPPQAQPSFGMPGMGALGGLAGAGLGKAGAALPQMSGLPPVVAFGMGLVAAAIALVFDVVFLHVHIPGVGGYAWYLTTALSFAGAGYFGIKWTRATQAVGMTALGVAGALYGLADIGLGLVLEDLPMGSALFLGIQGLVIAIVCGGGGVRKAMSERD